MHPIDIDVRHGDKSDDLLRDLPVLQIQGETVLVFAPSRREIARVVNILRKADELDVWAIPVTGAHIVEEQLEAIAKAQKSGKPVVVVATPGTMDSSVTIPGLSTVVIIDRRIRVDWNEYGVRERWSESLPINHIWQMVRRVGREKRTDGKRDKCFIISSQSRHDVRTDRPVFEPLTGCSPNTPIEDLLLEAVRLDVRFSDVHDYMVSTFSDEHIQEGVKNLLDHKMIQKVDDPSDPDGLELTDKGMIVINMPYEYRWSRLIVEAPHRVQYWLVMAASFGRLDDLQMFEEKFEIAPHKMSEVIRKINLGVEYINLVHDDDQRNFGQASDLSFRRMEQMETLFDLGCQALGLNISSLDLQKPEGKEEECLLAEIIVGGLRVGLFDLFLPAKGKQGGWSEPRPTPDLNGRSRRFFLDEGGLDLKGNTRGGVVAVVADQQWFTSRTGAPLGNLDNVSIVPDYLAQGLIQQRAGAEGWIALNFKASEYRGQPQMQAEKDGIVYIGSFLDNEPEPDISYWCSVDRDLGYGRKAVFVHYPVLDE
ncbi:MAG: helicase-related protein [bacterium]